MSAAVISGAVALLVDEHERLKPAEAKAILQVTSTFMPSVGLLGAGTGSVNLNAAVQFHNIRKSAAFGSPAGCLAIASLIGASAILDGSGDITIRQQDRPDYVFQGATIVWGSSSSGASAATIVWGTHGASATTIVWGNEAGDTIVWGSALGDTIASDRAIADTIVWGSSYGDTIVWGSSGNTIVWGSSGDTIVWGSNGDTIVWGTAELTE